VTASATATPVVTASATGTPVVTASATTTPSPSATAGDTPAPTVTATPTATGGTPVATATSTATPSITSTDPATPTATPTPGDLDHFQCYETHRPPLRLAPLSLVDRFGASTARLIRGKRFCAPASKNDEDPDAVSAPDHLTGYTIKQTTPRFARVRDVPVTNQFGTIEVDLVRPDYLLVPTGKSHVGPLPSYTAGVDHYKCYKARGRFRTGPVAIEDQFGSIVGFIKRAVRLCVPVDKNDEGVIDPITSVLCYSTRAGAGSPTGDTLYTLNQFGADSFDVFGARELCVPSTLP
jgi:hypothetical protein